MVGWFTYVLVGCRLVGSVDYSQGAGKLVRLPISYKMILNFEEYVEFQVWFWDL